MRKLSLLGIVIVVFSPVHDGAHTQGQCQILSRPISLQAFESKILNRNWKQLYVVNDTARTGLVPTLFNSNFFYIKQAEGVILTTNTGRLPSNGTCVSTQFTFNVAPQRKGGRQRAVFDVEFPFSAVVAASSIRIHFFTENPDEYLIGLACESGTIVRNKCLGDFFLALLSAREPPDNFPWIQAVKETRRRFRLDFNDPRSRFTRIMDVCPLPNV